MINAMTEAEVLAHKFEWATRRNAARYACLKADLANADTRLIEPDADEFLAKHAFTIPKGSARYREPCAAMIRAEIEQLKRNAERDAGNFASTPADPIVTEPESAPEFQSGHAVSITAIYERFERENPGNVRPETLYQIRTAVQHFAAFAGSRVKTTNITKAHIREWKEVLDRWPVKAAEVTAWKGLDIRQIIAANEALDHPRPTIARPTLRRYMGNVQGFCRWLVRNGYLDANPVADMLPGKLKAPVNKRISFTDSQLRTLFTSPLFDTCRSTDWRDVSKPGNVAVRDHRYWIPLIMAYSGARPGEIAQLHVGDVKQIHGIWTIYITEENGEGKRTKTQSSKRFVPVHSNLIERGFIKYCDAIAARGAKQIFPEFEIPKEGQGNRYI